MWTNNRNETGAFDPYNNMRNAGQFCPPSKGNSVWESPTAALLKIEVPADSNAGVETRFNGQTEWERDWADKLFPSTATTPVVGAVCQRSVCSAPTSRDKLEVVANPFITGGRGWGEDGNGYHHRVSSSPNVGAPLQLNENLVVDSKLCPPKGNLVNPFRNRGRGRGGNRGGLNNRRNNNSNGQKRFENFRGGRNPQKVGNRGPQLANSNGSMKVQQLSFGRNNQRFAEKVALQQHQHPKPKPCGTMKRGATSNRGRGAHQVGWIGQQRAQKRMNHKANQFTSGSNYGGCCNAYHIIGGFPKIS